MEYYRNDVIDYRWKNNVCGDFSISVYGGEGN